MSILDIILISLGAAAILTYLILKIHETKKYNKLYKSFIDKGLTPNQAKEQCDKVFSKKKHKEHEEDEDEEETFE